jgi:hypothetical protein
MEGPDLAAIVGLIASVAWYALLREQTLRPILKPTLECLSER